MFGLPPVTQGIIMANVLMFLLKGTLGINHLISVFALWPVGSQFLPWQLLTYAFLHGSLTHLLFNSSQFICSARTWSGFGADGVI